MNVEIVVVCRNCPLNLNSDLLARVVARRNRQAERVAVDPFDAGAFIGGAAASGRARPCPCEWSDRPGRRDRARRGIRGGHSSHRKI